MRIENASQQGRVHLARLIVDELPHIRPHMQVLNPVSSNRHVIGKASSGAGLHSSSIGALCALDELATFQSNELKGEFRLPPSVMRFAEIIHFAYIVLALLRDSFIWKEMKQTQKKIIQKAGLQDSRPHGLIVILSGIFFFVFFVIAAFAVAFPNPATKIVITIVNSALSCTLLGIFFFDLISSKDFSPVTYSKLTKLQGGVDRIGEILRILCSQSSSLWSS